MKRHRQRREVIDMNNHMTPRLGADQSIQQQKSPEYEEQQKWEIMAETNEKGDIWETTNVTRFINFDFDSF